MHVRRSWSTNASIINGTCVFIRIAIILFVLGLVNTTSRIHSSVTAIIIQSLAAVQISVTWVHMLNVSYTACSPHPGVLIDHVPANSGGTDVAVGGSGPCHFDRWGNC
jgi:disulfide bond formation protein DsbB